MNCFDNLIGISRTCNRPSPLSNLYLQDLHGMKLSIPEAATDSETMSGIQLIDEKIKYVQEFMKAQLRITLQDKININSIIENDSVGYYQPNNKIVPLEIGRLKGIKLRIQYYPYLEFFLSKVYLKLKDVVTTKIFVYDLSTGNKLDEIDITTVANTPTPVLVSKAYQTLKQNTELFICYDAGISDTYESTISRTSCYSCYNSSYINRYVEFTGASMDDSLEILEKNIMTSTFTYGLSLEYSLACSVEPFICNMGNVIAWPMLHKVGSEVMKEVIYGRRLNSIINIDKDKNTEMMTSYENEFMASWGAYLNNIKTPKDICFSCNSRIKKQVLIP